MPSLSITHLREQGQDMIIVPLDRSFGNRSSSDQQEAISEIQGASASAGLRGIVVPVWDDGGGRMAFIAPHEWHPFFRSIDLGFVYANLNRTLSW